MDAMSKKITNYLCRKQYIHISDKDIYEFGFKLLISDVINFSLVLLIGVALNKLLDGIVFLTVLCGIRRFSGGFHAKTFWLCRIAMIFTFLSVLIVSNGIIIIEMPLLYIILFDIISLIFISVFSPIKHIRKKLTKKHFRYNKIMATLLSSSFICLSVLLIVLGVDVGITITVTVWSNVFLMIIGIIKGKGGENDV